MYTSEYIGERSAWKLRNYAFWRCALPNLFRDSLDRANSKLHDNGDQSDWKGARAGREECFPKAPDLAAPTPLLDRLPAPMPLRL